MDDADDLKELVKRVRARLSWASAGGVVGTPRGASRRRRPEGVGVEPLAVEAPAQVVAATAQRTISSPPEARPALETEMKQVSHKRESLQSIRADIGDCKRCGLCEGRKNIVFGVGSESAPLVFVGEAPGADEDEQGEPFVGASGQLLTKMISAMGFAREDVYICNVVKCRPPKNRNPAPDEIAACQPFLKRQVASVSARVIVTLGKFAAQTLLQSEAPISALRGRFHRYEGVALMPTFHPAYLLRNPSAKKEVWSDLQQVMGELDRLGVQRNKAAT